MLIENLRFSPLPDSVSFEALARAFPWDKGMKVGLKKLESLGYTVMKIVIGRSLILSKYRRVTDRRTDRNTPPMPMSRSNTL